MGPMTEPAAGDVGTWLRVKREQSGLTLRQIADSTKLCVRTLDALERNRVTQLPGGIYCRAIVRAYTSEVGLDPEDTLRLFLAQHPQDPSTLPPERIVTAPPPKRPRIRMRMVVGLIGTLLPVLAGVFYFTLSARGFDTAAPVVDLTTGVVPSRGHSLAMMISVSSACRLQVVADGRIALARRVDAGELLRLELGNDVVFVGDDAGAVHVSVNGRAARALGEAGQPLTVRIGRDDYQSWLIRP